VWSIEVVGVVSSDKWKEKKNEKVKTPQDSEKNGEEAGNGA